MPRRPAGPSATQRDIAKRLGIGQITVSRVFTNPASVAEPTRQRVLAEARRIGYRRNHGARVMRTERYNNVVLLRSTSRLTSELPVRFLDGVNERLAEVDCTVTVAQAPDETLNHEMELPRLFREYYADGVIIMYHSSIPADMERLLRRHRIPAIWVNSRHAADCVRPDDRQAGRDATRELIRLGHRHIAYFDLYLRHSPNRHYSRTDRLAGYRDALADAGLPAIEFHTDAWPEGSDFARLAATHLNDNPGVTAAIGYGEMEYQALLLAAARHCRLRVPEDLSVVMIGDPSTWAVVPTMMERQVHTLGREAADMLLEKVARPQRKLTPRVIPYLFRDGHTTAPSRLSATATNGSREG